MKHKITLLLSLVCILSAPMFASAAEKVAPLKVLLVAGGCCHDYVAQTKILKEGIESRIHAEVTVVLNKSTTTNTRFEIYESDDWAKNYDVVIHDECSASVIERPYIDRILAAHKSGVPAVNLHCAMHSYRFGEFRTAVEDGADNAGWYEMLGLQSTGHGPKLPIDIKFTNPKHPITKGMKNWTTINEELYNNIRVFSGAEALASGDQVQPPKAKALKNNPDLKPKLSNAVVVWTNQYGPNKTKIFSTTLGHYNETVEDPRYLDLVTRGLLWSTGNLTKNGEAKADYAK
ncbi:MAG: hypothetical protein COA78_27640 [Blastopirellula sp.]|nr:MAG: hypothetical protein COA78_27640 [Blastopirellula sp.]